MKDYLVDIVLGMIFLIAFTFFASTVIKYLTTASFLFQMSLDMLLNCGIAWSNELLFQTTWLKHNLLYAVLIHHNSLPSQEDRLHLVNEHPEN